MMLAVVIAFTSVSFMTPIKAQAATTTLGNMAIGSIVRFNAGGLCEEYIVAHHGKPEASYSDSFNNATILVSRYPTPIEKVTINNSNGANGKPEEAYTFTLSHNAMSVDSNLCSGDDAAQGDPIITPVDTALNNYYYNSIDSSVRSLIKTVTIPKSSSGAVSADNSMTTKIFILNAQEVGGNGSTGTLSYYATNASAKRLAVTRIGDVGLGEYGSTTATHGVWLRGRSGLNSRRASQINSSGAVEWVDNYRYIDSDYRCHVPVEHSGESSNCFCAAFVLPDSTSVDTVSGYLCVTTPTTLGDYGLGATVKIEENGSLVDYVVIQQGKPAAMYDNSYASGTWLMRKYLSESLTYRLKTTTAPAPYNETNYQTGDPATTSSREPWYVQLTEALNSYATTLDPGIQSQMIEVSAPFRWSDGTTGNTNSWNNGQNKYTTKIFELSLMEAVYYDEDYYHDGTQGTGTTLKIFYNP